MSQLLDTILLFSLPASGKSEVRRYLASLTPDQCRNDFHMGPTLQLDDYPYVHLMHRIDDELKANGLGYAYNHGPNRPFRDNWTWAVLIELLNEDYANLMASRQTEVAGAAQHLFDRLDAAHAKVGLPEYLGDIPHRLRVRMAEALEPECRAELDALNRQNALDKTGRTLVIEAARGGAHGSAFPLCPPSLKRPRCCMSGSIRSKVAARISSGAAPMARAASSITVCPWRSCSVSTARMTWPGSWNRATALAPSAWSAPSRPATATEPRSITCPWPASTTAATSPPSSAKTRSSGSPPTSRPFTVGSRQPSTSWRPPTDN